MIGALSGWSGSCGGRPAVTATVAGRSDPLWGWSGLDGMSSSVAVVLTTLLGGRAFAERHGASPAKVVALHGWGRTRADWNATLQGYDALAIDLPGFGATPAPDTGWSTSEYAEWVGECLDEVLSSGGARPVLVGHSFGGRVAVRLAATNPELVRGIVLTGVPLLRPETAAAKPALSFRALRFLNKWHFISNDLMERERRKRGSADYRAAEGEMREVLVKAVNEDYADALDAVGLERAAGGDGLGRARHGRDDGDGRAGPSADRCACRPRGRARLGAPARRGTGRRSAQGHRRLGSTSMSATANVLVGLAISLLALASYLRWWRVAQREHYEPGRLVAMAAIWCRAQPVNLLALVAVLALCLVGLKLLLVGLVGALVWLLWPPGLALLRPTQKLVWTPRVRRLAAITVVLHVVITGFFLAFGEAIALVPLLALPIAEVALLAAQPLEDQLSRRYEVSAAAKIKQVAPRVVAITGSYGKTSTKNYAAHLMAGRWSVLASPASFNNVLGLARSVNDRLTPGTDVFVAEMGTYGPGEIARLCRLFPPEVAAITTIGEAHLERMKDRGDHRARQVRDPRAGQDDRAERRRARAGGGGRAVRTPPSG